MSPSKSKSKEIRVGAFLLVSIGIILFFVFLLGGQKKIFGDTVKYRILFSSTAGLYEGDPVLLMGVEIGNVSRIGFCEDLGEKRILVEITVDKEAAPRIRKDTRARIGSASIVYGKVILLSMGSPTEPELKPGDYIPADETSAYSAIVDSTTVMLGGIHRVISKIESGRGIVSMLLNEPVELRSTLDNLSMASDRLARILERLERGEGFLGGMLSDTTDYRATFRDFQRIVRDLKSVTADLKRNETTLGTLLHDSTYAKETLTHLQSSLQSLSRIMAKIDTGKGTLGLLINDPELYEGLRDVMVGTKKSPVLRWIIQDRRKSGKEERLAPKE